MMQTQWTPDHQYAYSLSRDDVITKFSHCLILLFRPISAIIEVRSGCVLSRSDIASEAR